MNDAMTDAEFERRAIIDSIFGLYEDRINLLVWFAQRQGTTVSAVEARTEHGSSAWRFIPRLVRVGALVEIRRPRLRYEVVRDHPVWELLATVTVFIKMGELFGNAVRPPEETP